MSVAGILVELLVVFAGFALGMLGRDIKQAVLRRLYYFVIAGASGLVFWVILAAVVSAES